MVGLFFEKPERGIIAIIMPLDPKRFDVLAYGLHRTKEFPLLDGKGADAEIDRRAFGKENQRFEKRKGILASRHGHGNAVAIADHFEAMDGFSGFAQQGLF